jgi:hypothetical protein
MIATFNKAIDALVTANNLPPTPDFYAWFSDHPEDLCTVNQCEVNWIGINPSPTGSIHMHQQWAATLDPLYSKSTNIEAE